MVAVTWMSVVPWAPLVTPKWYQIRGLTKGSTASLCWMSSWHRSVQVAGSAERGNGGTCINVCRWKSFHSWGWAWCIDGLTLEEEIVMCNCELYVPRQIKKWMFNILYERIHKLITLKFYVRVRCLSYLYGCSGQLHKLSLWLNINVLFLMDQKFS